MTCPWAGLPYFKERLREDAREMMRWMKCDPEAATDEDLDALIQAVLSMRCSEDEGEGEASADAQARYRALCDAFGEAA